MLPLLCICAVCFLCTAFALQHLRTSPPVPKHASRQHKAPPTCRTHAAHCAAHAATVPPLTPSLAPPIRHPLHRPHYLQHPAATLAQHSRTSPPVPMQRVLLQHSATPALHARRHSRLPLRRPYAANTLPKLSPAPCCMPLCPGMPQHSTPSACQCLIRPRATLKRRHCASHTPPLRRPCRPSHYATTTPHSQPTHMPQPRKIPT